VEFASALDGTLDAPGIGARVLRSTEACPGGARSLADAWLSEDSGPVRHGRDGGVRYREASEGICGTVVQRLSSLPGMDRAAVLEEAAVEAYDALFEFLARRPRLSLVRLWNHVPPPAAAFQRGRARAFAQRLSGGSDGGEALAPPAVDVACAAAGELIVEFYAAPGAVRRLACRGLEADPCARPLKLAHGAVLDLDGQRLLFSGAMASVAREGVVHPGQLARQVRQAIQNLRVLVSQFNLKPHGIEYGFGLEDLVCLRAAYSGACDAAELERALRAHVDPDCRLSLVRAPALDAARLVQLDGIFLKKGEFRDSARRKYEVAGDRIRVESLELHAVEHCNLRCRGCDANSPFNPPYVLPVADARCVLARLAAAFRADIFKVMGGEPLLHPEIVTLLGLVRASGITRVVRLTTNGLLVHRMPDAFWRGLDRLTVSNYSSAPIRPEHVERIVARAEESGVVLNLKWIDQFNEIELTEPIADPARVQSIYDDCWIRHRSLVVRRGVFYKCTRAAYMDDFRRQRGLPDRPGDAASYREADGIPIDAPDFAARALAYLNSPAPLASCRYCLGAAGRMLPHAQLDRERSERAGHHVTSCQAPAAVQIRRSDASAPARGSSRPNRSGSCDR
jgi:organic radical activating enzyme